MRIVIDSSVVVAALATPNPESASRLVLAAVAAGLVELVVILDRHLLSLEGPPGVRVLRPGEFLGELRSRR